MRNSKLWLPLAALGALGVVAISCQPAITVAQTSIPGAASPTAPATAAPAEAAPSRGREAAATPVAAVTGNVCNPCMVMRVTSPGGKIGGEVAALGKEGTMEVLGFEYDVKSPRDVATGQLTGRRQYQPIIIRKTLDKATPLLMKAMMDGTPLTVSIDVYRPTSSGGQERFYTIMLEGVVVVEQSVFGFEPEGLTAGTSRRTFAVPHVLERSGSVAVPQEEVTLTFRKVTQTSETGKTMAEDSWQQ